MDSIEKVNGCAPDLSNNTPGIIEHSDKTCISLDISSTKLDNLNLSNNKHDSAAHSIKNPDGVDRSHIKPDISVSYRDKSDSIDILHDCPEIPIVNGKVVTPDMLSDIQDLSVFSSSKIDSYINSSNKYQEADPVTEVTGSGAIFSEKPGSFYFSPGKPGSCDFSCDKPWSENFPSRKSRSSDFFSENIWGSNFSSDDPETCDFFSNKSWIGCLSSDKSRSDDFSSGKIWGGEFSTNKPTTCDVSGGKPWNDEFSSDNPVTQDFSGDRPWNADFSSDSTSLPLRLELLNDKLDDYKHSSSLLKNLNTSNDMLENTDELGFSSYLLNGKSFSATNETKESKNTNVSSAELNYAEESNNCFENPKRSNKSFDSTERFIINDSVIPSYLIETSGILGYDSSECKTEKDINDIPNFSCINSNCPDYESLETFDNGNKISVADGIWKIEKCQKLSNACVLKRLDEDTQYQFKCIYFNKGTKLDELFKNRSHDELNVSQDEILECIDSMKEDQLNYIEDPIKLSDQFNFIEAPIKSNDQSGFLEIRMGTSLGNVNKDLGCENSVLIQNSTKEQIDFVVDKLLNDVFYAVDENEQNSNGTYLGIKTQEKEMIENRFNDVEIPNVQIYSNELGVNFKTSNNCEILGSQVQEISGYLGSTDSINDSVTETTNPGIQLDKTSIQQKILVCVKFVWESIFGVMLGVLNLFFFKTKSLTSTECATTQTIPETVSDYQDFQSETNITNEPSTSYTNTKTVSSKSIQNKTSITNFSTLFQHLSATVGTDMTAERAMKDINSQVVMDIYNGFHELRIVDYGSLDLMSKCIKGSVVTLQRTMSQSNSVIQKASVLLRKKTHTLEEMRKLNEDLKDVTSDAEVHLHNIDRALTGLEDFTDDFMYYKNAISKELVDFLLEDFPEIFK